MDRDRTAPSCLAVVTGQYPATSMTFVDRELRALRRLGWQVQCFSLSRAKIQQPLGDFQEREAARTVVLRDDILNPLHFVRALGTALLRPASLVRTIGLAIQTCPPGVSGAIRQVGYFLASLHLALRLRDIGAVHVHNHLGDNSGTVTMLASHLTGRPFSMTLHGPEIFEEAEYWHLRTKIALSAFVACISQYCRARAMARSNSDDWDKLRIVRCGIEPVRYASSAAPPEQNRVLYVGRLEARKGAPHLIEALKIMRRRGVPAQLTLVGTGSDFAKLQALAEACGVSACVHFSGSANEDQVARYLREHDAVVVPSLSEGLPVVIMEAMASARPVIASAVDGIPELVRDGHTGKLVPPGDPVALATAIGEMLEDRHLRDRCVHNARAEVLKAHDAFENARLLSNFIVTKVADAIPARNEGICLESRADSVQLNSKEG